MQRSFGAAGWRSMRGQCRASEPDGEKTELKSKEERPVALSEVHLVSKRCLLVSRMIRAT
jgi:hypothetical protein